MINRRRFLPLIPAAGVGIAFSGEQTAKAPFRTIYSNDTTHILSCIEPDEREGVEVTDELVRKSILEAGGADAHFLQPGLGWVPWWKSEIYSAADHQRWLQEKYDVGGITRFDRYILEGGDLLAVLVDTCKESGVAPFLSFRLNDGHHTRDLEFALERGRPTPKIAKHYWENYEKFRLGPNVNNWDEAVFDWAITEVRDYKFALLEEACTNYDIAGLELDFLRHWNRFSENTPHEKRVEITTNFVRRVREMLDRTAAERGLPRRWLCVRVPAKAEVRPEQGIDLAALARAGVDMVNLSWSYFTVQDDSVTKAVQEIGDDRVSVYAEMTHCTMTGKATAGSGTQPFLRTTDEQFYTTAHLVREQGAQGVSLFNFPYYRYHVTETIGPFHEPPFDVLPKLADDAFLAKQPQWYFLTAGRNDPILGEHPLPTNVSKHEAFTTSLQMAPTPGHRGEGVFRLRSDEDIRDRTIEVRFNGELLEKIAFVEKPLPHPYDRTWLAEPERTHCFRFPAEFARKGANQIEIRVTEGIRVRLRYLDVTLPIA